MYGFQLEQLLIKFKEEIERDDGQPAIKSVQLTIKIMLVVLGVIVNHFFSMYSFVVDVYSITEAITACDTLHRLTKCLQCLFSESLINIVPESALFPPKSIHPPSI